MTKGFRPLRTAGEFLVIVVGVMVALAGDDWRQSREDARTEALYLDRLRVEVEDGQAGRAFHRGRIEQAQTATLVLLQHLSGTGPPVVADSLARLFLVSGRVGFAPGTLGSDVTHRELVGSGQLRLLSDPLVLEGVTSYYRDLDMVWASVGDVFPMPDRVARLTGYLPYALLLDDPPLTAQDRARLVAEIEENPAMPGDLRELHSDLTQLLVIMDNIGRTAGRLLDRFEESG